MKHDASSGECVSMESDSMGPIQFIDDEEEAIELRGGTLGEGLQLSRSGEGISSSIQSEANSSLLLPTETEEGKSSSLPFLYPKKAKTVFIFFLLRKCIFARTSTKISHKRPIYWHSGC